MLPLIQVHAAFALISLLGFMIRGFWMMRSSPQLGRRWVKVTPHVVDTLLLVSGVALVIGHQIYPTEQSWLAAKLLALLLYIILGSIALKRGKTPVIRISAFFGALVVFAYMLMVANTRAPLPF